MPLEAMTHISDLVVTNPVGATDPKSQGDDHIRGIKTVLKNDLPNITGPVTASQAELNILDGATLSTAELNILDGVTATAAELNILDGLLASTAELNFVDGVTSNIQTQLNSKPTYSGLVNAAVYTPTVVAVANCTISSVALHSYMRLGNFIVVSGSVQISVTAVGILTSFRATLPVAGDLSDFSWAAGSGATDTLDNGPAYVVADPVNDQLGVNFYSGSATVTRVYYTAMYRLV